MCLLHDQVERCSHLDRTSVGRLARALFGRTLGRLAARRRRDGFRRSPEATASKPTRHVVDLADGAIHRNLEDLVTGSRQQLPTGGTQCLRTRAPRAPGDSLGRGAARAGGGRGHQSPLSSAPHRGTTGTAPLLGVRTHFARAGRVVRVDPP